jgi:hypothetical protein
MGMAQLAITSLPASAKRSLGFGSTAANTMIFRAIAFRGPFDSLIIMSEWEAQMTCCDPLPAL